VRHLLLVPAAAAALAGCAATRVAIRGSVSRDRADLVRASVAVPGEPGASSIRSSAVNAEVGRVVRGLRVSVGLSHSTGESRYLSHFPGSPSVMLDFGLKSRATCACLVFRTPASGAGAVGALEVALPVDGAPVSCCRLAASAGVRF
jgi:hypothetical protein